jgi:RNA polymerase sigma factor (TIGR02999 family)
VGRLRACTHRKHKEGSNGCPLANRFTKRVGHKVLNSEGLEFRGFAGDSVRCTVSSPARIAFSPLREKLLEIRSGFLITFFSQTSHLEIVFSAAGIKGVRLIMSGADPNEVWSSPAKSSEPFGGSAPPSAERSLDASSAELTRLLVSWRDGDPAALEHLTPMVYDELRRLAGHYMRRKRPGHTLQRTAVVHEAYIRLIDQRPPWNSRAHFFAIAAQMMRRILVDHAKGHVADKRGPGAPKLSIEDHNVAAKQKDIDILALHEALKRLARMDPQQRARIVEMRFFGGLPNDEIAATLGISPATVQRQLTGARVWLQHEMKQRT